MSSTVSARQNVALLEEQYSKWCEDPQSVEPMWSAFFEGFELGVAQPKARPGADAAPAAPAPVAEGSSDFGFFGRVVALIYNYRTLGHTQAHINPLEEKPDPNPRLCLDQFKLTEKDLDREAWNAYFRHGEHMKLRDMVAALEATYSGKIGFEFMHIHNTTVRHWIRERIESHGVKKDESPLKKLNSLRWVLEAEAFENFLGKRFLGEKRFSNEGGEGAMILLNAMLEGCPSHGVREIEMGMSHRGRMCVLANFVRKTITTVLYEFTPQYVPDTVAGDGDVKYHLGYESIREVPDGKVRVSLAANPSHLEAVNPVVEGKARARQRILNEELGEATIDRSKVLPILLHGDAAFAGQGSVAEVLNLSQLPGYRTGGTIHIIVNNQIGFTTIPADARSSDYATDVAKMIESPIIHINGEDPMELYWAANFALEFRQRFGRDFIIDMYCYRRQGHNELDQAAFTSPLIAKKIADRPTFGTSYKKQLVAEGVISATDLEALESAIWNKLEEGYQKMIEAQEKGDKSVFTGSTAVDQPDYSHAPVATGISKEALHKIGTTLTEMPEGFRVHPTLAKRLIPRRAEALQNGGPFDWAFAEALSFGSLLLDGKPVRLSGQDVGRGTFSHRHCVLHDYESGEKYVALEHIQPGHQAKFCVHNSLLSEFAVLGFDYGYSLSYPNMLTLWEAQFGDFANGAQVIIDQFISSAESKWQTPSDLVMLLPHGYEGQGPEHSSARLERFLQLCAENNMIVGNFTTPAQYFHALRRQKHRDFRKPLVIMTPKSLLTRAEAVSAEADFLEGSCFQEVLPDPVQHDADAVTRVVFCSGKVFYDLAAKRQEQNIGTAAIIRIEQLYPFHNEMAQAIVAQYPNVTNFVWCQEEPRNMGAWTFIRPRLEETFNTKLRYAGRDTASSPATGAKSLHYAEQKQLLAEAFTI